MRKGESLNHNELTTNTFEVHKKAGTPKTESRVGKQNLILWMRIKQKTKYK
jgi:hypothetical protein